MAVIIEIRKRFGWILMAMIGLAIISFLLLDPSSSGLVGGNGNLAGQSSIATINGQPLENDTFNLRFQVAYDNQVRNNPSLAGNRLYLHSLKNQMYDGLLRETLLNQQYDMLGISVTKEELNELVRGANPHPYIKSVFGNGDGTFSPANVQNFITNLGANDPGGLTSEEKYRQFAIIVAEVKNQQLQSKYNALATNSLYTPNWLAGKQFEKTNTTVRFNYVFFPYSEIGDDKVSYTDEELTAYIDENSGRFQQDESRIIEYISFAKAPSKADTAEALKYLNSNVEAFKTAKNDSLFVRRFSDRKFSRWSPRNQQFRDNQFDYRYYTEGQNTNDSIIDQFFALDDSVLTGENPAIIGPYVDNKTTFGSWTVAKLTKKKLIPDSIRLRKIVFNFATPRNEAEQSVYTAKLALSDSLFKSLSLKDSAINFESYAIANSDDSLTRSNGGEMGYITYTEQDGFPAEVLDRMFLYGKEGGISMEVTGPQQRTIFQIVEAKKTAPAIQVAFLTRDIEPSDRTIDSISALADKFANENNSGEAFAAAAGSDLKEANELSSDAIEISGMGQDVRHVVKWVYDVEEGTVSSVFGLIDQFAIVHVKSVRKEGVGTINNPLWRGLAVEGVVKQKKAETLRAKISGTDLNSIASSNGKSVQLAADINFYNNLVGSNNEPKVAGTAIALEADQVSKPIEGVSGVYVLQVTSKTALPLPDDLTSIKQELFNQEAQRIITPQIDPVFNAVKKAADIKDDRALFY